MVPGVIETGVTAEPVLFEPESFELVDGERLLITGRWFGVRGRRFVRPTLTLIADGTRSRALAVLEHKPWSAEDGELWTAAFPFGGLDGEPITETELAVAPDIAVTLPPPKGLAGARARSGRRRPRHAVAAVAGNGHEDAAAPSLALRKENEALREGLEQQRAELERLRERLTRDELAKAEVNSAVARRDAAVDKLDAVLAERDEAITRCEEALAARDAAVAARDAAVAECDAAVRGRERVLRERDAAARALEAVVRERDRLLHDRATAAAQRDSAVREQDRLARVIAEVTAEGVEATAQRDAALRALEQERRAASGRASVAAPAAAAATPVVTGATAEAASPMQMPGPVAPSPPAARRRHTPYRSVSWVARIAALTVLLVVVVVLLLVFQSS